MTQTLSLRWHPQRLPVFDKVVDRFAPSLVSFTESQALKRDFWDAGEDARLREDERFCPTPWGRWTLANRELINNVLFAQMQAKPDDEISVADAVSSAGQVRVFCSGDPRFLLRNGAIRLAGQRDLTSAEGRERITKHLCEHRKRFFETQPPEPKVGGSADADNSHACLVCLDAEAGGLHLEIGPLTKMPSFVKKLAVSAGLQTWIVLASNLRHRRWQVAVQPAPEPYRWTAPGHEDLLAEELAPLTLEGLPPTTVKVFRIDAAGVGCPLAEPTMHPGQEYRLLVPPALGSVDLTLGQVNTLEKGWRLWDLEIPADPPAELRAFIEQLGLKLGEATPQVRWVVTPPVAYQETFRGESYPCFDAGAVPTLRITTEVAFAEGDLTVFLLASDVLHPYPLPGGKEWILDLGHLSLGHYVVNVLHRSTQVSPQLLPFAIVDHAPASVGAQVKIRLRSSQQTFDADGRLTLVGDLSALNADELEVSGPPLWPVEISWDSGRRWRLMSLSLGSDGMLDTAELLALTAERRRRSTLGDLHLDFGELGFAVLRHARQPDAADLCQQLARLVDERASTLGGLGGQFALLRSLWLDPLLALLGYEVQDLSEADLSSMPAQATALLLSATSREADRIVRRVRRVLMLTTHPTELGDESCRAFADRLCEQHGVNEALITNGLLWTRHRIGTRYRARSWDLRSLVVPGVESEFEDFLFNFRI